MNRRGQTLVLMALTMLLVVLMVCMTLGIASRAREKQELQTLADGAAYTNAIAMARTYNASSLMNRTMVGHYAAMAAVQAEIAWTTLAQRAFGEAAGYFREYEATSPAYAQQMKAQGQCPGWDPASGPPTWYSCEYYYYGNACAGRTSEIRDAASELWHAGMAYWNPNGQTEYDNANKHCTGSAQNCSQPRQRVPVGIADLDKDAAEQVRDLHEAIIDLAKVQRGTWDQVQDVVEGGLLTKRMLLMAQGKNPKANAKTISDNAVKPYKIWAEKDAWDEVDRATADESTKPDSYQEVLADAVMGTRNDKFVISYNSDNITPRMQGYFNEAVAQNLMNPSVWPKGKFVVKFTNAAKTDVKGVFTPGTSYPGPELGMQTGMDAVLGIAGPLHIYTAYKDSCTGKTFSTSGDVTVVVKSGKGTFEHDSDHCGGPLHAKPGWPNDHGNHVHYDEVEATIHQLDDDLVPKNAVGYVFPTGKSTDGRGIWGVPKMPVMLTKTFNPNKPDPWELDFKFKFTNSGAGTRLDLKGGSAAQIPLMALSNGVAYYHRRGAVQEPPNLLNPYWHATLVPQEIDEYTPKQGDGTPGAKYRETKELSKILTKMNEPKAAKAYNELRKANYLGVE